MNIVWYSEVKWNYLRTRKQNLLTHFPINDRILFFQPFSFVKENFFFPRKEENVYYLTLPTYRKSSYKFIDTLMSFNIFRNIFYKFIKWYANAWIIILLKKRPDCICISNIYYLSLIDHSKMPVIWDYNDDPEQFGKQPEWAMKEFEVFLRSNNKIISCSIGITQYLLKKYKCLAVTIPNGVELSHFNKDLSLVQKSKKIVIGYVGIISSWFFDFELVKMISQQYRYCEIHLYGPCDKEAKKDLNDLLLMNKNIKYEGSQSYYVLPEIMRKFNVGIIPLYSIPEVWRAASGKLLQYLGVGIPVVSVWMEQYSMLKENVYFTKSHAEFIGALEKALKQPFMPMGDKLKEYDWEMLSIKFRNELLRVNE